MKLRLLSDIHFEMCMFTVPAMTDDKNTILLLPGDICVQHYFGDDVKDFFKNLDERFKAVIYVPGNHEYYNGHLSKDDDKFRQWFKENTKNIHFLNRNSMVIDDVAFIGATLWTDVNKGNPYSKMAIEAALNDYRRIRTMDYRKLNANDTIQMHFKHKNYIFEQIKYYRDIGVRKVVVLVHHAPSEFSVHPQYKNNPLNPAFFSNMEEQIMDCPPDLIVHGHTHNSFRYNLESTEIICNPRGYAQVMDWEKFPHILTMGEYDPDNVSPNTLYYKEWFESIFYNENPEFDPFFRIEI